MIDRLFNDYIFMLEIRINLLILSMSIFCFFYWSCCYLCDDGYMDEMVRKVIFFWVEMILVRIDNRICY